MPTLDQLITFASHRWYLVLAFFVILVLLLRNLIVGNKGSISPVLATQLINRDDATVLDVSAVADFAKGHVIGAINVPFNSLANQLQSLQKYRDKPLIVTCKTGATSKSAVQQLRKAGFDKVFNLQGGMQAWQTANLPITRKK